MFKRIFTVILLLGVVPTLGCNESVPQTDNCARYVECVRSIDARDGVETDTDRFEEDGACWGSEEGATLCDRACNRGFDYLSRQSGPLPTGCQS